MNEEQIKALYEKAVEIARETAVRLARYDRKVAAVYYSRQKAFTAFHMEEHPEKNKAAKQQERFANFQAEALKQAAKADERTLKQVAEMEALIQSSSEKIRSLYEKGNL